MKATVGLRTNREPRCPTSPPDRLSALTGVQSAELRGEANVLHCTDSDAAIRALLRDYPQASDIEIAGAGLEEAFLLLTGDQKSEELS